MSAVPLVGGCGDEEGDGADLFDADRAYRDVEAQVEIGPRPAGSPGSRQEVAVIERELREAGVAVAAGANTRAPPRASADAVTIVRNIAESFPWNRNDAFNTPRPDLPGKTCARIG